MFLNKVWDSIGQDGLQQLLNINELLCLCDTER